MQTLLHTYSTTLCNFGFPSPTLNPQEDQTDDLIAQQLAYDHVEEATLYATFCNTLNHWQQLAHDAIMASIASDSGKLFFLYGHGGSGKTYLYNCVVAKVRSEGQIALVVASSGIAATLLPGGVTAHSRFKIPINIDHSSTCVIKKGTSLAHLIQQATLIVWDEAPMVNRLSFEAVDRTLCDIMNTTPFGGKIVILGGDFRQTLPVITHGRREDSLGASLTRSYLWNHCILLRLHSNMRINDSSINTSQSFDDLSFPDWVLAIGDGVYSNLQASYQNVAYIRSRAIITPINKVVTTINDYVLGKLAGTTKIYLSADTLTTTGPNQTSLEIQYPTEFLNGLSFNGLPEHQLSFKPYGIVMLLRNLNSLVGLCNGTRILLTHLATNVVRGLIIGGTFECSVAVIPRIILDITDPNWPFTLRRKQFPLRLCYAMTINKSQGQTLDKVGLYLPTPVFSHGQLYVAVSRVRSADGLHIYIENPNNLPINVTRNIVFDEVFEDLHIHCETNVTIPN
ncbi:ATP-dependent DNA helicase PIF1 [Linum perenne]